MSADNFLGIYQVSSRNYIARNCWAECEGKSCEYCNNRIVFTVKSIPEAVRLAEKACGEDLFEYGYRFLNLD